MLQAVNVRGRVGHSRSGFLILMLIAFSSIILGLSVTFYLYCSRGTQDSQVAVRIAQRRLAFQGAINAIYAVPDPAAYVAGITVDLEDSAVPRSKRLGWYRIRKADATYMTNNASDKAFVGMDPANCLFVTAGTGPSNGDPSWNETADWRYELRRWYVVEMEPPFTPPFNIPKRVHSLFPPPPGLW